MTGDTVLMMMMMVVMMITSSIGIDDRHATLLIKAP